MQDGKNLSCNVYKRTYYVVIFITCLHVCLLQTEFLKGQMVFFPLYYNS